MVESLLLYALPITFLITVSALRLWIRKAEMLGFLWEDMNKPGKPKNVASSGGVIVIMSFVLGILYYIAIRTFLFQNGDNISLGLFSLLSVVLILAVVGIVDDMFGWNHGGLSKRIRMLIAIMASIPLVVINAGNSTMSIPFLGAVDLGIFYPLFIIPLGVSGATTTYNFLAGYNGLEAGQGILILSFLSFVAYKTGSSWLSLVGLIMVASLFGFYLYNKYPAKVFPGDSLTWSVGALIAAMAILGNFEKIAVFIFIPYIIETGLKLRGGLKKASFGKPNKDGSLELPYDKIYGLEHLAILVLKKIKPSKKVYEQNVVHLIFAFQILIIALAWILFL